LDSVERNCIDEPVRALPSLELPSVGVVSVILFAASALNIGPEFVDSPFNFIFPDHSVEDYHSKLIEELCSLNLVKFVNVERFGETLLVNRQQLDGWWFLFFFLHYQ
jgi:hypothetical protein